MENFWNLDMKSQNIKENLNQWIGGEHYIQTSLYNAIKNNKNFEIINIETINQNELFNKLVKSDKIIVPGWINLNDFYLQFKDKILTHVVFEYTNLQIPDKQILCQWKHKGMNGFLPITAIDLPENINVTVPDYMEQGLMIGKCISHVVYKNKADKLLHLFDILPYKVLTQYRTVDYHKIEYLKNYKDEVIKYNNIAINHCNVNNIGILNPIEFRLVLRKLKYVLFYHGAAVATSIIDALYEKCIILGTIDVIPSDLHTNKNIYLIDDWKDDEIIQLIKDIHENRIEFDENAFPSDYTIENKLTILNSLNSLN